MYLGNTAGCGEQQSENQISSRLSQDTRSISNLHASLATFIHINMIESNGHCGDHLQILCRIQKLFIHFIRQNAEDSINFTRPSAKDKMRTNAATTQSEFTQLRSKYLSNFVKIHVMKGERGGYGHDNAEILMLDFVVSANHFRSLSLGNASSLSQ